MVDIRCDCGAWMHLHESQTSPLPATATIVTRCHGCRDLLLVPAGLIADAFAQMRADGWIA